MIVNTIATAARTSPLGILLNPTFWIVICIWTAVTAIYCVDVGAERERFKQQKLTIDALEAQERAAAKVLEKERALRQADTADFIKFQEAQAHAEENARVVIADLERNNRRLRIPVRIAPAPAHDGSGPLADSARDEGFAEPTLDFSEQMVDLLSRGDSAIRKHAEVVDRYERLRITCTAPVE